MVFKPGLCFIFIWILVSGGTSFVTDNKTTWNEAITKCTMKTPTIMFQGKNKEFHVNYELSDSDVWVGYYLAAASFHYIGCVEVREMKTKAEFDHNTPGLCYSACLKKGVIGISKKKCYCLNDTEQLNVCNNKCEEGCKDQEHIACGDDKYMSLYSIESPIYSAESKRTDGECLLFKSNSKEPNTIWFDCREDQRVLCALSDGTVQIAFDADKKERYKSWRESMNICFELNRFPSTTEQLKDFNSSSPSWTGVIKSDVIFSIDDSPEKIYSKQFGYLKKNHGEAVLKFEKDPSVTKKILCETATKTTTSGSTTSTTEESNKVSATTETSSNTDFSVSISSSMTKSTINMPRRSSDFAVPVSILIATIFIVSISVVIVLLKKKRAALQNTCCWHSDTDTTGQRNECLVDNKAYEIPENSPYDEIDDSVVQQNIRTFDSTEEKGNYAHNYFVLEKDTKASKIEKGIAGTKAERNQANVYNTLNSNKEPRQKCGGTYDTTEKANMRLKYQHEVADNECKLIGDNDEDAYNHIDGNRMRNDKTDNAYGNPVEKENDYAGTETDCKNDHVANGTYNHIYP